MGLSNRQLFGMARAAHTTETGLFEYMVEDPVTGEVAEHKVQDVEPILDNNKRLFNQASEDGGRGKNLDWKRFASIPNVLLEKWLFEEGIDYRLKDHWPAILAKLDSPEYLFLRTAPGRLSRRPIRSFPTTRGGKIIGQTRDARAKTITLVKG